MRIIVASTNDTKIQEIKYIVHNDIEVVGLKDIGIADDVQENGSTYLENARLKASHTVANYKLREKDIVIADDTGLEIDKLNGELGLYSARFMGYSTPYKVKNEEILTKLYGVKWYNRTARYVCGMVAYIDGCYYDFEGVLKGNIGFRPIGKRGVAFDPIFYVSNTDSLDSISFDDKMSISHRKKALERALALANRLL